MAHDEQFFVSVVQRAGGNSGALIPVKFSAVFTGTIRIGIP